MNTSTPEQAKMERLTEILATIDVPLPDEAKDITTADTIRELSKDYADSCDRLAAKTTAEGAVRLCVLADFLDTLPPEKFSFQDILRRTHSPHACGTVACAIGWVPVALADLFSPKNFAHIAHELVAADLCALYQITVALPWNQRDAGPMPEFLDTAHRCMDIDEYCSLGNLLFAVATHVARELFAPVAVEASRFNSSATPALVALRIRHFVATGEVLI